MSQATVRALSAEDSKRIICSANDCTEHAELVETVPLYTGSLAFYYFCHACFKKTDYQTAKTSSSVANTGL